MKYFKPFLQRIILKHTLAILLTMALSQTANAAPAYQLPEVGSYNLPALGKAADGIVVNSHNKDLTLHQLMSDKLVLLSFIYSTCNDVNGCPMATGVFYKIKNKLKQKPELAKQIRLITLSFDPSHDTPEVMARYGKGLQSDMLEWHFLTTRHENNLAPILQSYTQDVQKIIDETGKETGKFAHILRVFLIDPNKHLRNIYSVDFLDADLLINDLKTLLIQEKNSSQESTKSSAVTNQAKPLNKTQAMLGLPPLDQHIKEPLTEDKINLGKKLFFDRRLSHNDTFSCANCHIPQQGFSSYEMQTAVGFEGRTIKRNTPTLYNVAFQKTLFHDGREHSLENQVWAPLLAQNEMANPSIGYVIKKIQSLSDYHNLFEHAYGEAANLSNIGHAIASYERTLNSANSPFDRWYFKKDRQAMSLDAQKGYQLFTGKAGCNACHLIEKNSALFTDHQFHNTGIHAFSQQKTTSFQKIQLAPGIFATVDNTIIQQVSEPQIPDLGRYEVSLDPADRWKFKTPGLRNISLTAPYMHDGSLATLKEVISFYNQAGSQSPEQDPLIRKLNLSDKESQQLIAFLNALTGSNTQQLIEDAYQQPIGNVTRTYDGNP